ncbi:hypothetical protein BXO88_10640 [Oribacterium sp. C9]|uniref:hypothetical protein n=1 Tax=Oribacterium sp. C9 TaxID=1943579 RepID=UPI00098EF551|nr:hypothetical protein [Oribacterium sp. C9]OON85708.1 hypothetical protein BXO88_10640 [Oribacterium sp. C9]
MSRLSIDFSCGHKAVCNLTGNSRAQEEKIQYLREYGICGECFKEEKRKERIRTRNAEDIRVGIETPEIIKESDWNEKIYGRDNHKCIYLDGDRVDLTSDLRAELEEYLEKRKKLSILQDLDRAYRLDYDAYVLWEKYGIGVTVKLNEEQIKHIKEIPQNVNIKTGLNLMEHYKEYKMDLLIYYYDLILNDIRSKRELYKNIKANKVNSVDGNDRTSV